MRPAAVKDLEALKLLMHPLELQGILLPRSEAQLLADLPNFYVVEDRQDKQQASQIWLETLSASAMQWHLVLSCMTLAAVPYMCTG